MGSGEGIVWCVRWETRLGITHYNGGTPINGGLARMF